MSSSYFAYGTLVGTAAMQEYCPSAQPVAIARYPGHRLAFRQYSDDPARCGCHIEASDDDLYGVVYDLSDDDMAKLDDASGVGKGWFRRIPIEAITDDGETIATTTYELVAPGDAKTPSPDYVGLVRIGSESAGLPAGYRTRLQRFLNTLP